jgi:magnesium-transporting ATPase (P-type)
MVEAIRAGLLCNDATLEQKADDWCVHGDPMEGALVVLAVKAALEPEEERQQHPRTDLIPFESEHKFMATLHHGHDGRAMIYLKGAPEQILARCAKVQGAAGGDLSMDAQHWQQRVDDLANQGQRVLAVASKPAHSQQQSLNFNDVDEDLTLLGLFGLIDPPRAEALEAVAQCRTAGIRVKMITGDHAGTARAIAAQLDLENSAEAMTGHDLDQMDDATLGARAREVDVYARVSPEHKLRLVALLQAQGGIVAMTGDGVNDAPALKRADVGIAMGHKGTEAAKEASEMVIADDNFASIVRAVEQGRTVYDNLKKAIVFLLPINGGEALSIMIAVLFGFTLPITPVQILWVNMVSSVALAMALAFEATEPETMRRPPRRANEAMLSGFLLWRIALVSMLMAAGVFGIFSWVSSQGATLEESRTYAVNTLVAMEVFYLFSVRYLRAPSFKLDQLFNSRAVLIAVSVVVTLQLFFTYAPVMERFFDTRPVTLVHGLEVVALGVALFVILELEKLALRSWRTKHAVSKGRPANSEAKS